MKTLILSDLHLGSRASKASAKLERIARLANGFDRVVFNGDTLDCCYSDPALNETASTFLKAVKSRCGGRNGEPELLSGNHDPAATDKHFIFDETSSTLVFHGDTLADCTHPTKESEQKLMVRLRERWDELGGRPTEFETLHKHYREVQLKWLPIINPYKKSKTVWQYTKSLFFPPRRPFDVVNYWRRAPGLALKVAKGFRAPFKHLIFGHSHRSGRWQLDGVDVLNTGSYMPFSKAMAVILDGERVSFEAVDALTSAVKTSFSPGPSSDNLKNSSSA